MGRLLRKALLVLPVALALAAPAAGATRLGTITIPRLHREIPYYQGVAKPTLHLGAGHWPETWLPGEGGVVALSAHRVTPTAVSTPHGPFYDLNLLRPGNAIFATSFRGRFLYRVWRTFIVSENDTSLVDDRTWPVETLFLVACHPRYSSRQRIVVVAKLVGSVGHA